MQAPQAQVQTCGDWDMRHLLRHVGEVHRWCAAIVRSGAQARQPHLDGPDADISIEDLAGWYREGLVGLCGVLGEAAPEAPAWTFSTAGHRNVGWWQRRMVVETAVHRWDAQQARSAGSAEPTDADVAVEGIEEYVTDLLPRALQRASMALQGTLHLHATDDVQRGEWLIDFGADPPAVSAGHAKADTAIRGPSSDLLLWLWNRLAGGGARLEVFGSADPVTAWPRLAL